MLEEIQDIKRISMVECKQSGGFIEIQTNDIWFY